MKNSKHIAKILMLGLQKNKLYNLKPSNLDNVLQFTWRFSRENHGLFNYVCIKKPILFFYVYIPEDVP